MRWRKDAKDVSNARILASHNLPSRKMGNELAPKAGSRPVDRRPPTCPNRRPKLKTDTGSVWLSPCGLDVGPSRTARLKHSEHPAGTCLATHVKSSGKVANTLYHAVGIG